MRFYWRGEESALRTHDDWLDRIDGKNRQVGTSAPTLASAWAGPLDLLSSLAALPEFAGFRLQSAMVEGKATFDTHGGNVHNHDLVVRATTGTDESVIVCVEAKAGEDLGETILKQRARAAGALADNPRSKASRRLDDLLERFGLSPDDPRTDSPQYQLLTAWAGTLADAVGFDRAVFALHEFRTDERPEDRSKHNRAALDAFAESVLRCELPDGPAPWCLRVPDVQGTDASLYVAHVVTDLRSDHITR